MMFTKDSCGIKSSLIFLGFIVVGMILWDLIDIDSGGGGTPYGDSPYYESI